MSKERTIINYFDKFRYEILAKLNCSPTDEVFSEQEKIRLAKAYLDIVSEG
ncbi:hypothetical protein PMIT1306_01644 [Prochlorococcus sp. MIT 1306]|nr:hypothetical protein PMIT1306_01644 [Prochlorococcus sp. MIT 1306]